MCYHSPPPTGHQLPKASYSPEPTIVSEILSSRSHWTQGILGSRNLFSYWFHLLTWNTWDQKNLSHWFWGQQQNYFKEKKKQLLLFHILQNALSYRSTCLTADKFARALWLLKLSSLKSTGFHKSSILILWVFHYKQITIWCLNWWKDAYGLIAPMQRVMSWDTHLHPYSRVCISQMWMTTL